MKKAVSLNLFLASAMIFSSTAWGQDSNGSIQDEAAHITLDQVVSDARNEHSLIHKLEKQLDKLCGPSNNSQEDQTQREIVNGPFLEKLKEYKTHDSKLARELSRYPIRLTIGDMDGLIDTKYFFGGAGYQYVVEPAFRNNEQIRKDIWTFQLGLRTPTDVVAGVSTTVRLTFSRFYGGKNAKWNAIKACPYFLTQTPTNTNDIKTKLRKGDGFRFEVIGNTGLGTSKLSDNNIKGSISAGVKTEALFLMDLFRDSRYEDKVRTRLLGIKNKGEFSIGFNVKNESPLSFIKGKLKDALTLGFGGLIRKSISLYSLSDKYPLDTMMVDYRFKFSTPHELDLDAIKDRKDIAEAALEQLLFNIRRIGFASLFFSSPGKNAQRDQELGNNLLKKVQIAEDLAKEDLERYRRGEIRAEDMRVRSFFKGRMQSDLFAGEGSLWFSEIISKKGQFGSLDSFVTSYDENMKPHYYNLVNTFERAQTRKYLGRQRHNYTHDFDVLVQSNKAGTSGRISDIVLKTEIQDTDLDADDIRDIKNSLARSLPVNFRNNSDFNNFFPETNQTNATLSHRYVFGHEAFVSISQIEKNRLGQMLYEFLNDHPEKKMMHLPVDNPVNPGGLGTFALEKAYGIAEILNPRASSEESMEAFKRANRDPIFDKYIVGEFFASILPQDTSEKLFGLNLKLTSRESGTRPDLNLGGKTVSPVYEAVSFLKAIISDTSLNLQMVETQSGSEDVVPSTGSIGLPAQVLPKN